MAALGTQGEYCSCCSCYHSAAADPSYSGRDTIGTVLIIWCVCVCVCNIYAVKFNVHSTKLWPVYRYCFVTQPLTINETIQWLALLFIRLISCSENPSSGHCCDLMPAAHDKAFTLCHVKVILQFIQTIISNNYPRFYN